MRKFVESLKRLHGRQYITDIYLTDLLTSEKITQDEYDYIVTSQ